MITHCDCSGAYCIHKWERFAAQLHHPDRFGWQIQEVGEAHVEVLFPVMVVTSPLGETEPFHLERADTADDLESRIARLDSAADLFLWGNY